MPLTGSRTPSPEAVPVGVVVRQGTPADVEFTGALAAQVQGEDAARCIEHHARKLHELEHHLFVAEVDAAVEGYGWVSYLRPRACGGHGAPDGWYLSGVVVAPHVQRQGLGLRLTSARIDWVLDRCDEVYYVVSASNHASLRLHGSLGMTEISRDFDVPGFVFARFDGVLCRGTRGVAADVVDLASHRKRNGH